MAYVTIGNVHYTVYKGKDGKYYYIKDGKRKYTRAKVKSGSKPKTVRKSKKTVRKSKKTVRKSKKPVRKSKKPVRKSKKPVRKSKKPVRKSPTKSKKPVRKSPTKSKVPFSKLKRKRFGRSRIAKNISERRAILGPVWEKVADGYGVWVIKKSKETPTFVSTTRETYDNIVDKLIEDKDIIAVITSAQSSDALSFVIHKAMHVGLNRWNTILSKSYYKNFTKPFGSKGPKYRILAV